MVLTEYEMNEWAVKLSGEWTTYIWKQWVFGGGYFLLWVFFFLFTFSMLSAKYRNYLMQATGTRSTTGEFLASVAVTWYLGMGAHSAIFHDSPYSYYLQLWLGDNDFEQLSLWFWKYFTLFGPSTW